MTWTWKSACPFPRTDALLGSVLPSSAAKLEVRRRQCSLQVTSSPTIIVCHHHQVPDALEEGRGKRTRYR